MNLSLMSGVYSGGAYLARTIQTLYSPLICCGISCPGSDFAPYEIDPIIRISASHLGNGFVKPLWFRLINKEIEWIDGLLVAVLVKSKMGISRVMLRQNLSVELAELSDLRLLAARWE